MKKLVIFDLDGVLVTTDELHFQAWKQLADELGITGFTKADNARQRGVSRMASLEVVLEKTDRKFSYEEKTALAEKKNDIASGDPGVFLVHGRVYIRTFRLSNEGFVLTAENEAFEEIDCKEFTLLGKIIAVQRFF